MHRSGGEASGPRVLVVCTANQFRSPYAELLLNRRVAESGLDWSVSSAGTRATPGRPMDSRIAQLLAQRSIAVPTDWRSRRATSSLLEHVDIVLAMEQHHRRAIVELWPPAVNRSFVFGQFASMVAAVGAVHSDADALLEAIRLHRGTVQPRRPEDYEVPDPAGRSARRLRACTERIAELIDEMLPAGSAQRG